MRSGMGFRGDEGEVLACRRAARSRPVSSSWSAWGPASADPRGYAAPPAWPPGPGNAASVGLVLPANDAEHVRAVADGFRGGDYPFTPYKSSADESALAEVSI